MKTKKKLLSLMLVVVLSLTLIPMTVFAQENENGTETGIEAEVETKTETEVETEPETETEAEPGAEPEAEPEEEPGAAPEVEPETEPEAEPKARMKAAPEAEAVVETWADHADTSWFGDGSAAEYRITTAAQLAGLAKLVNEDNVGGKFDGKVIYLENDLDLTGYEWVSIGWNGWDDYIYGRKYGKFSGTFDGQGHVVRNLYSHETGSKKLNKTAGLFGALYKGEIKNLGVVDADIERATEDSCDYGHGILADVIQSATITNCWTTGTIVGSVKWGKRMGGITGYSEGNSQIKGCYSTAVITGNYASNYENEFDSVGGILGMGADAIITDCWFDGKIEVNSTVAAVGGIVGYSENTTLNNCLVSTKNLGADGDGNTYWIGYEVSTDATNCYWPNDDKYARTVQNKESGNSAGTPVDDFKSKDVLEGLQKNAGEGINWVAGVAHPTFSWDEPHILANYDAVDAAVEKVNALKKENYKDFSAVQDAMDAVDWSKNTLEQETVNGYAAAIEAALAGLEYKDADYTAVDNAIAKAGALNKADYKDFSAVEKAIAAVVRGKNITEQETVNGYAAAIENALKALQKKTVTVTAKNTKNPQTGDHSNMLLWAALLVVSGAAVTTVSATYKKRKVK